MLLFGINKGGRFGTIKGVVVTGFARDDPRVGAASVENTTNLLRRGAEVELADVRHVLIVVKCFSYFHTALFLNDAILAISEGGGQLVVRFCETVDVDHGQLLLLHPSQRDGNDAIRIKVVH